MIRYVAGVVLAIGAIGSRAADAQHEHHDQPAPASGKFSPEAPEAERDGKVTSAADQVMAARMVAGLHVELRSQARVGGRPGRARAAEHGALASTHQLLCATAEGEGALVGNEEWTAGIRPAQPHCDARECDAVGGKFHPQVFGWMVHANVFCGH